jgi:beta-phosphoglucomutase
MGAHANKSMVHGRALAYSAAAMQTDTSTTTRQAFLFDMDGTLVDNMRFHNQAWVTFFGRRGQAIDADAFFVQYTGRHSREILREYLGPNLSDHACALLGEEKDVVYRALHAPHLAPMPGLMALLSQAKGRGMALAVATAAPEVNIRFTLDGLDLRRHFDAVVGAADVARGKPEPDVFLEAARRCGVPPSQCIVFEDAPLGVLAAQRAGMRAAVLTTTLPASAFAQFDNVIAAGPDFNELAKVVFAR